MVYKLGRNSHKGRWEDYDYESVMAQLRQELDELEEALERGNMVEILLEAADVANFSLIIAAMVVENGR